MRGAGGARGFTMIEIMIVIALMAVIMAIGVPTIFRSMHRTPMQQAVADLQQACRTARITAILRGQTAEVVIRATDGSLSVQLAPPSSSQDSFGASVGGDPSGGLDGGGMPETAPPPRDSGQGSNDVVPTFSAHLPDSVTFRKLTVNLRDMMDEDEARIHFYANGTSEAMTATFLSEQNEERTVSLEITTGRDLLEVGR